MFDYRTAADNTCGPGFPGTVTPYLHVANDSAMQSEFGRWFGIGYTQELKSRQLHHWCAVLQRARKMGVGVWQEWRDYLAQFQATLANVAEVGVTFGGGCFRRPRHLCNGRNGSNGGEQFYR